jgi:hypothetical protein
MFVVLATFPEIPCSAKKNPCSVSTLIGRPPCAGPPPASVRQRCALSDPEKAEGPVIDGAPAARIDAKKLPNGFVGLFAARDFAAILGQGGARGANFCVSPQGCTPGNLTTFGPSTH